jgi:hypothetical protein
MALKRRVPEYDIAPDAITRADIVPAAARFAEDSLPDFDLEHDALRNLVPYPRVPDLPPRWNEPTVPDVPLRKSMATPRVSEGRGTGDTAIPRSGTRHRPVSEPPPPPPATLAFTAKNFATWGDEPAFRESARPTADPSALRTQLRPLLVVTATTLLAAAVGTSLGNGSLAALVERRVDPLAVPRPAAVLPAQSAPARASESTRPGPSPEPQLPAAEPPAVRFEDLPLLDEGAPRKNEHRPPGARRGAPKLSGKRRP